MFKKKNSEIRTKRDKNPVVGMIIKYTFMWVLLSVILTDLIGRSYYQKKANELKVVLSNTAQYYMSFLKKDIKTDSISEGKIKNNAQYVLQLICSSLADRFYSSYKTDPDDVIVETSGHISYYDEAGTYDATGDYDTYNDNKAYLVPGGEIKIYASEDEEHAEDFVYTCPQKNLDKVIKAVDEIKDSRTGWEPPAGFNTLSRIFSRDIPMTNEDEPRFRISLVEGYISDTEFRPVKVKIKYNTAEETGEEIIDFGDPHDIPGYQYVTEFPENVILLPEDGKYWKNAEFRELASKRVDISGLKMIVTAFPAYSLYRGEGEYAYAVQRIEDGFVLFGRVHSYPFNFLKGDITFSFSENLRGINGEIIKITVLCYAHGGLKYYNSEFFKYMLAYYFVLFDVFLIIACLSYRRQYSLKAKNRFHKTLINAMANDLKVPLTEMKESCEELVENVNTEKKELYARQIMDKVHTVNALVNKNLNMSPDKKASKDEEDVIYLMDIFGKAEAKYREELERKELSVTRKGDTYLTGKEDVFSLAFDKLLEDLVGKAFAEQDITVTGKNRSFVIVCKTDSVLEPSMAEDVFKERGWYIRQKYNKKTKMLTYMVIKRLL
ncbi:MAG: HAMP domain-containing histidine kinase [Lachnospiraceae bacterium]|nr:HAMP domain-containing histidine kinase [Lachnospiraceae bacterium]